MASLPSPPPSPLDRRRHRRSDSFALLQAVIKEREKEEHQEEELLLKSRLIRFSCPPAVKTIEKEEIIIPHKSLSHHSVRFTTEPPKVYHYTV
ncbi:uncharacterized protein EV154DRAFT_510752 [Mucor mucedo]|uniref:uncharacterized protein n=1 Tax=Mucor mucedo TaxID=29922 RepID=UPI0022207E4E|nr:uncharacterized protein EV154DRAFT_510752 [Mucor mucedo]KAI7890712.1 hypothetical protein EV154DRAFT_510752 [Mucor mucedo]